MKLYCYQKGYPDHYTLVNRFMKFRLHDLSEIKFGQSGKSFVLNNKKYNIVSKQMDELKIKIEEDIEFQENELVRYIGNISVKLEKDFDFALNNLYNLDIRISEEYLDELTESIVDQSYFHIKAVSEVNELTSMFRISEYLNVSTRWYDIPKITYFDKYPLSIEEIARAFWE